MQFALLIYESPELFAARQNGDSDPYTGAWRVYYKDSLTPVYTPAQAM